MTTYLVFSEEQFEAGLDEVASTFFHGGFVARREIEPPVAILDGLPGGPVALTFAEFARVNTERCRRWHGDLDLPREQQSWTGADWSNAMAGECGEAANIVKKIRRQETGADRGPSDPDMPELIQMLADEIGDVIAYTFLLARFYDIDVAEAVASKFNRVSERQGFPERVSA